VAELAHGRRVVAVGRLAQQLLEAPYVRHPSHGGATGFRDGLLDYASAWCLRVPTFRSVATRRSSPPRSRRTRGCSSCRRRSRR
jgi:hypothetical protein